MKKLILLLNLFFIPLWGTFSQEPDTTCRPTDEVKHLLKWAEYGFACDSILILEQQKDSLNQQTIFIQGEQLKKENKAVKRLKIALGGVALVAVAGWVL